MQLPLAKLLSDDSSLVLIVVLQMGTPSLHDLLLTGTVDGQPALLVSTEKFGRTTKKFPASSSQDKHSPILALLEILN